MSKKQITKTLIDFAMTALLPLLTAYSLVGETAHECLGIAMFGLMIAHNVMNVAWYKSLFKGKYTAFRFVLMATNFLLLIDFLLLMYSGINLSEHVLPFLPSLGGAAVSRILHMSAARWGIVMMSFHLGLNISRFTAKLKMHHTLHLLLTVCAALAGVYGIYAFVTLNYPMYLFPQTIFMFSDMGNSLMLYLVRSVAVMVAFVLLGNTAANMCKRTFRRKESTK